MEEIKKHALFLDDGRRAEKIVQEEGDAQTGGTKTITEVWAEPKIEKKLTQRVVDYRKPVVHRREIEVVDENTGEVVERKVESIEPEVKMELREHIQTNATVSAQSANECDCYVTQEDMQKTFSEGFMAIARILKEKEPAEEEAPMGRVSALQVAIGDKVATATAKVDTWGLLLWGTIAVLAAAFVYVVFFM